MVKFGGGGEKCTACRKTVYCAERQMIQEQPYHINCVVCSVCHKKLTPTTYCKDESGAFFCKAHFLQALSASGGDYKDLARSQSKPSDELAPPPTDKVEQQASSAKAAVAKKAEEEAAAAKAADEATSAKAAEDAAAKKAAQQAAEQAAAARAAATAKAAEDAAAATKVAEEASAAKAAEAAAIAKAAEAAVVVEVAEAAKATEKVVEMKATEEAAKPAQKRAEVEAEAPPPTNWLEQSLRAATALLARRNTDNEDVAKTAAVSQNGTPLQVEGKPASEGLSVCMPVDNDEAIAEAQGGLDVSMSEQDEPATLEPPASDEAAEEDSFLEYAEATTAQRQRWSMGGTALDAYDDFWMPGMAPPGSPPPSAVDAAPALASTIAEREAAERAAAAAHADGQSTIAEREAAERAATAAAAAAAAAAASAALPLAEREAAERASAEARAEREATEAAAAAAAMESAAAAAVARAEREATERAAERAEAAARRMEAAAQAMAAAQAAEVAMAAQRTETAGQAITMAREVEGQEEAKREAAKQDEAKVEEVAILQEADAEAVEAAAGEAAKAAAAKVAAAEAAAAKAAEEAAAKVAAAEAAAAKAAEEAAARVAAAEAAAEAAMEAAAVSAAETAVGAATREEGDHTEGAAVARPNEKKAVDDDDDDALSAASTSAEPEPLSASTLASASTHAALILPSSWLSSAPSEPRPLKSKRSATASEGVALLQGGRCEITKISRNGKASEALLHLSEDGGSLTWDKLTAFKRRKSEGSRSIQVGDIHAVLVGRDSDAFQLASLRTASFSRTTSFSRRHAADVHDKSHLSLSLVLRPNDDGAHHGAANERETFDFCCENEEQFGLLVAALRALVGEEADAKREAARKLGEAQRVEQAARMQLDIGDARPWGGGRPPIITAR